MEAKWKFKNLLLVTACPMHCFLDCHKPSIINCCAINSCFRDAETWENCNNVVCSTEIWILISVLIVEHSCQQITFYCLLRPFRLKVLPFENSLVYLKILQFQLPNIGKPTLWHKDLVTRIQQTRNGSSNTHSPDDTSDFFPQVGHNN